MNPYQFKISDFLFKANSGVRKSVGKEAYYAQTGIYMYDANTTQI